MSFHSGRLSRPPDDVFLACDAESHKRRALFYNLIPLEHHQQSVCVFGPIFVSLGHRCGTRISAAVNSGCFPTARSAVDLTKMAMRAVISRRLANPGWDALAARSGIRRGFSGKFLGEEERAAENIYIKVRFHFLCSCRFCFSSTPASLAQGLKNVG
jgi:hypothetical protein